MRERLGTLSERWLGSLTLRVGMNSRVKIRDGKENATPGRTLKSETVGFVCGADTEENTVTVWINPALAWQGTSQEFLQHWQQVDDTTSLTF